MRGAGAYPHLMSQQSLPAPPRTLAAILDAASDPSIDVTKLGRFVQSDPSFAGLVLKLVNTTAYQGTRKTAITDLRAASLRLGVRTLRNLALCHAARSCVSTKRIGSFDLDAFWEDSVRRAVAATLLARQSGAVDPSEAFTIGLLQELGVLALLLERPDRADQWKEIAESDAAVRLVHEVDLFGTDHAAMNATIASDWKLPDEIALPLRYHHHPEGAPEPLRDVCRLAGAAESLGAVVSHEDTSRALQRAQTELPGLVDIPPDAIDGLIDELGVEVGETARAMGIAVGPQPTLESILTKANRSLVDMNFSYEELVRKLEQTIAEKKAMAAELEQKNRELQRISITDVLTGLPNRRELFRRLRLEVLRIARHGDPLSVVVADIDHFKRVNDNWGHVFGDLVLQKTAEALHSCCRESDLVARTGGEEFAAIFPATDLRGASQVARRMLDRVERGSFASPTGESVCVTISIGIAWMQGPHLGTFDPDVLVNRLYTTADQALYRSKSGGRNRASRYPQPLGWTSGGVEEPEQVSPGETPR